MAEYKNFGAFLTAKREERDITLRELARKMGVSPAYLSDIEKKRSTTLTKERLDSVVQILRLSKTEQEEMFDLVGRQNGTVAPDIPEYVYGRDYVAKALRRARDLGAGEAEWLRFVEELEQRENH